MKKLGIFRVMPAVVAAAILCAALDGAQAADGNRERVVGKWYPSLESGVVLTQSSYSDNWSGGDRGSIVWAAILNGTLENQVHEKANWYSTLKLAYGQTHKQETDGEGGRTWARPEKSTDLVDLETIMRLTLGAFVDPFVSARLESQFQDVSDPLGRNLTFNPVRLRESAGIARSFIDEEDRSLLSRLGFTFRQGIRRQFMDNLSDDTETETTNDGGVEWTTDYKTKILEDRVTWTSRLTFYQPVFYSGKDDLESLDAEQLDAAMLPSDIADYTTVMDIDFENIFTTQITRLLSVSLYTRWMYAKYDNSVKPLIGDDGNLTNEDAVRGAIRRAGQFKQTLSLGVTYRFL